jgi:hypothetical protein
MKATSLILFALIATLGGAYGAGGTEYRLLT